MSRRRVHQPWLAASLAGAVVTLVCACTGSEPTPEPRSDADAGTELAEEPTLRTAMERLRQADTGSFTQTLVVSQLGTQTISGVYEISSQESSMTMVWDLVDDDDIEFRFIGIRDVTYLNTTGWPGALKKCWLRADAAAIEEATGMQSIAGTVGLPANLVALSHAKAPNRDATQAGLVLGTTDLVSAATMFGSGVMRHITDPTKKASVPAEFILEDGEIRSWSVSGDALDDALKHERMARGMPYASSTALSKMDVDVEYADIGDAVQVRPPKPALQMSGEQMQSGEGCAAAGTRTT